MGIGNSELGTLDSSEMEILRTSWELVMENAAENGPYFFGRFLKKYNYFSYFKKFANIPPDRIMETSVFKNHAVLIVSSINKLVSHTGTDEELLQELFNLGSLHCDKNLNSQQFVELKTTILDFMEKRLHIPLDTLNVWNKAFDISYFYVFQVLNGSETPDAAGVSEVQSE